MAQVQVGESGTLSGTVFGDYYWIPQHHNEGLEGNNGFWFRRIYLTYEQDLGSSFSTRVRLEMSSAGDFSSDSDLAPVVKDAYLKWAANDQHEVYVGISSTPTFGLVEDVWGYRDMEKSPLDLQDFDSSRDFGIAAKGTFGSDGRLFYHAMFGNGSSNGSETNQGKKIMGALGYQLTEDLVAEAYAGYTGRPGGQYTYTWQGFLGFQKDALSAGLLYARQQRQNSGMTPDRQLDIASVFTHFAITGDTRGILRVDHMFDPNPGGEEISYIPFSNRAESTLIIAGVDMEVGPDIHLMPNIEAVVYGETPTGVTPETDLIPRLTLSYTF